MSFGLHGRNIGKRKPKKMYAYLKSLYGEELEMHLKHEQRELNKTKEFTDYQRHEFKRKLKERVKEDQRKMAKALVLSGLITLLVLAAIVWFLRSMFNF